MGSREHGDLQQRQALLTQLRLWSHDAFGEDLIINPRAGGVYYWDTSSGVTTRAVDITSLSGANLAPTKGFKPLLVTLIVTLLF